MIPVQNTQYSAAAIALLLQQFKDQITVPAFVGVFGAEIQILENAIFSLLDGCTLADYPNGPGPWDMLDKIGAIVGLPRNGLDDASYVPALKIQIRVNRSNGLAEDIIQIAALLGGETYLEYPPAAFLVEILNIAGAFGPGQIVAMLTQAKAAGTYGVLHYTTYAPGNDFEWVSRYGGGDPAAAPWGSRYSPSLGGLWVAGAAL